MQYTEYINVYFTAKLVNKYSPWKRKLHAAVLDCWPVIHGWLYLYLTRFILVTLNPALKGELLTLMGRL